MDEPRLPSWTTERLVEEVEVAPGDAPFRTPGRAPDAKVSVALTQSIVPPGHGGRIGVGIASVAIGLFAAAHFITIAWPLSVIAGVLVGGATLRAMLQPRLTVRAGPDGVEVIQSKPKVRHFVARRQVRGLEITRLGETFRLEAIDASGARRPLVVSNHQPELVALAETIATHLELKRE